MRILIYSAIICLGLLTTSLFSENALKAEMKIEPSILNNPIYQTAIQWRNKKFGSCAEWKNYLIKKFPDIRCKRFNSGKYNHWECKITDEIWTDANWHLNGTVRIFQK
jgi:hypothetical protein